MKRQMMKAPFPWFGGKSRIAAEVWERFGDVANYVEPFAGSLAVLLGRPSVPRVETVNDADCYLANFWRALQHDPHGVAAYADWPVNEADLAARRRWLVSRREWVAQMKGDPDFYDVKVAGWWVWGVSQSIGDSWCGLEDVTEMPHLGNPGTGIHRSRLPHLGDPGTGIHRSRLPHLGDPGTGIQVYFEALARRLRRVRVTCGDWKRVLTPSVTTKHGVTAVFLDPPYEGYEDVYTGSAFEWNEVAAWAYEHGDDPGFRIALCGYDLRAPERWETLRWSAGRGYSLQNGNRERETIVFSPHCRRIRMLWEAAS